MNRETIYDIVKLFYKPTFKTFYVNSSDGKEFTKPLGVFISLGMTTSIKTMENIRDFIASNKNYKAKIVEISSIKVDGQFLNTLEEVNNPKQYKLSEKDIPSSVMTKEEVMKELEDMKNKMTPTSSLEIITEYSHKVNKLQHLVNRLDESNGWDLHMIQRDGEVDYRIFHLYVNYELNNGKEYRLGILVTDDNKEDTNSN